MHSRLRLVVIAAMIVIASASWTQAGEVSIPNSFTAGTPAVAAQVNANFTAVKSAVDDNDNRVAALEATVTAQANTIAALLNRLEALETSQVMALEPYVSVEETADPRGPLVQLTGVNLQIVNGEGSTDTVNGLGNLIVGYDEENTITGLAQCSDGAYADQAGCESNGGTWGHSFKTGSHYLVLGSRNNYTQYGGLLAGLYNFSTGAFATVTGGSSNSARGSYCNVSGGGANIASGFANSVSGGQTNIVDGSYNSVSGGQYNTASGDYTSISGGRYNETSAMWSSISAGYNGAASANYAGISGGASNTASGSFASVSGGGSNNASGGHASVSGGRTNNATGSYSSVGGGYNNTASGTQSSVSGGETTVATGQDDWAAASLYEDD